MRIRTIICSAILLALVVCSTGEGVTETPTATAAPTTAAPTEEPSKDARYLRDFEMVGETVNRRYFDPTFGGLDWEVVHERYEPLIAEAESDETCYRLINQMLFELEVSHLVVVPPGAWTRGEPAISAPGETGLSVRLLDGKAVTTVVTPRSPADEAGLRPGFVI